MLRGHTDVIRVVLADQRWVYTASDDRTLRRWDRHTGLATVVYTGHSSPVTTAGLMGGFLYSGR